MAKRRPRQPAKQVKSGTRKKNPGSRVPALVVTIGMLNAGGEVQPGDDVPVQRAYVARDKRIVSLAEKWTYILRSRTRWKHDQGIREEYRQEALEDLVKLGVPEAFIEKMAAVQHVEVELHSWDPDDAAVDAIHEAAAEFPWEYLLSAATRAAGRRDPILITRLFQNQTAGAIAPPPRRALFIENAPGRIDQFYEFDS